MKVFKPWVFQGSARKKNYFEGWYFKHVSEDLKNVYSIIPGISLSGKDSHSFVQVINGLSGETGYFRYPLKEFNASAQTLSISVGKSNFTDEGISLNLKNKDSAISGEIRYDKLNYYPSGLLKPGIMGWYSFVPFMECKHGIVSTRHKTSGEIHTGNGTIDFKNGTGYIEKDWGSSFPESWLWLHCNTFTSSDASLMLSVAKIPWLGNYFIGFISYLTYEDRLYNFSTWSGASIEVLDYTDNILHVILVNKKHKFTIRALNNNPGDLKAPVRGSMSRTIKETVDADIEISLTDSHGKQLFHDNGKRGGMELIEKILTYFD